MELPYVCIARIRKDLNSNSIQTWDSLAASTFLTLRPRENRGKADTANTVAIKKKN